MHAPLHLHARLQDTKFIVFYPRTLISTDGEIERAKIFTQTCAKQTISLLSSKDSQLHMHIHYLANFYILILAREHCSFFMFFLVI